MVEAIAPAVDLEMGNCGFDPGLIDDPAQPSLGLSVPQTEGKLTSQDRTDSPEYRCWYDRGWRYSHRDSATLDYGDSQGFPDSWYDGYHDFASGRPKWAALGPRNDRGYLIEVD